MTVTTRPAFDPDAAEENSRRKAVVIAAYAHRLGITHDQLMTLPYSDKHDRKRPTLRRFAAAAYRDAGVMENPPHNATSDTWGFVREELAEYEDRERFGMPVPDRDLLGQRDEWLPPRVCCTECPTGCPDVGRTPKCRECIRYPDETPAEGVFGAAVAAVAGELNAREEPLQVAPARPARPAGLAPYGGGPRPALVTYGSPPLLPGETIDPYPPRGWDLLAALGPVEPERPCRWCGQPAVVGTLNGWRCAEHWPVRQDPRGDWGWAFNWAPKPGRSCLRAVCYCGRCPHYDVGGAPLTSLRGEAVTA